MTESTKSEVTYSHKIHCSDSACIYNSGGSYYGSCCNADADKSVSVFLQRVYYGTCNHADHGEGSKNE